MFNVDINAVASVSWSSANKFETKNNFKHFKYPKNERTNPLLERFYVPISSGYSSSINTPSVSSSCANRIFVKCKIDDNNVNIRLISFFFKFNLKQIIY